MQVQEQPEYSKANPHPDCGLITHYWLTKEGARFFAQWVERDPEWHLFNGAGLFEARFNSLDDAKEYARNLG